LADVLAEWWQVFVLVYLPHVAVLVSSLIYAVVTSRLDHAIPDTLPQTAGDWLHEQLEREGPKDVRAVVTGGGRVPSQNAFYPRSRVIQLKAETYFKSDPVYWAIAAHELGHARFRTRHPWLATSLSAARRIKAVLAVFGLGLVAGNILYALPDVTLLAFRCLAVALVLDALVLVEEVIASRSAARLLSRSAALSSRDVRAVRVTLFFAFCTYFASFLSHAVLLSMWQHVVALTGSGQLGTVAAPLGTGGTIVVAIATGLGLIAAFLQIATMISPTAMRELTRSGSGASFLLKHLRVLEYVFLLAMLALVWDLRGDPTYAWCVILAAVPALSAVVAPFHLPLLLAYLVLERVHRALRKRHGIHRSAEFVRAEREGEARVAAGNRMIAALAADDATEASVRHRVAALVRMLYLPLLVVYWLG
jgi:Zn-dependent membrane protease YugP